MKRTRTVAPDVGRSLAAVDGALVSVAEVVSDYLLPDLPSVVYWPPPAPLTVPRRLRDLRCPECDGPRPEPAVDPLDCVHDELCGLGAEEDELLRRDLRRLARHGQPHVHRHLAEHERDLLDAVGLEPTTVFVGIHARPGGGRRRTFAGLNGEPALTHTTEEKPR